MKDLSAVAMEAALHFDISIHNFGIQEYMRHTKETGEVFPHAYYFADDFFTLETGLDWALTTT